MYLEYDVYHREKRILQFLNSMGVDWCPQLVQYDDTKNYIIMNYCGETINKYNKPKNFREQLENIMFNLKIFNLKHNDIKESELLIKDGKVILCDFGWCSMNDKLGCDINLWNGEKPCNIYKDETVYLRLNNLIK